MDPIEEEGQEEQRQFAFPPKPVMVENTANNWLRSIISLLMYALMFYFLFEQNIAYVASILLVIIIHEAGHFTMMKRYGYNNVRMFIIPLLGAFTSGRKSVVSQREMTWIIIAGPVPGIIAGCILFWLSKQWQHEMLHTLAMSFLLINLFNCLPFHPLDGGRLMETLFFRENYVIRLVFGIISIVALTLISIGAQSLFLLIVPFFIGLELFNERKLNKIREYLTQEHIAYRADYSDLPDKSYWLIRDCLIFSYPKRYGMLTPGRYEYTPLEPAIAQHVASVLQTPLYADMKVPGRVITIILFAALFVSAILFMAFS